jgi:hypothetical protein
VPSLARGAFLGTSDLQLVVSMSAAGTSRSGPVTVEAPRDEALSKTSKPSHPNAPTVATKQDRTSASSAQSSRLSGLLELIDGECPARPRIWRDILPRGDSVVPAWPKRLLT